MANKHKRDQGWAEAKTLCRLNQDDIRMAKELGLNPRSLIKNIPNKSQLWKAPVKYWIRDLYEKHERKIAKRKDEKGETSHSPTQTPVISPAPVIPNVRWSERILEPQSRVVSLDEARWERLLASIPVVPTEDERSIPWDEDVDQFDAPSQEEIEEQNILMLRRQKRFRMAATCAAKAFSEFPWVQRVVLYGSVARPLWKEVPRFYRYKRAGIEVWHECQGADLAVWVSELGHLNALGKARARAVAALLKDTGGSVAVAYHQINVLIFEPETDRYLGGLCFFNACPKDKRECEVKDCGAHRFLQQYDDFHFDPGAMDASSMIVLFSRQRGAHDDEIPF